MQPVPVFNPAGTALGYAAAKASLRTAEEVWRLSAELQRMHKEFLRAQEDLIHREERARQIDIWTRELEHRGMSPMRAHEQAQREWDRLALVEEAHSFSTTIEGRVPSVLGIREYRLMVRAKRWKRLVERLRVLLLWGGMALLVWVVAAMVGFGTYTWSRSSEGFQWWPPIVGVAAGLVVGVVALGMAWIIGMWWKAITYKTSVTADPQKGCVPEYLKRVRVFLDATQPVIDDLDARFKDLGPSVLHADSVTSAQKQYRTIVNSVISAAQQHGTIPVAEDRASLEELSDRGMWWAFCFGAVVSLSAVVPAVAGAVLSL